MIILAILSAATISISDLRKEFVVAPRDAGIVRDAISRWSIKDKPAEKSMKNRIPIVFYLAKQRCVALRLRMPSVGGDPVYCYKLREDVLTESNEEVE